MAKQDRSELKWVEIDVESLEDTQRIAYDDYKAAYKAMKSARECFEEEMQSLAPEGKRLVFGYNFGKLSVAVTEKAVEKAKAGKQSLSQYLAGMQNSGRRC
jgi:hypothetical protein